MRIFLPVLCAVLFLPAAAALCSTQEMMTHEQLNAEQLFLIYRAEIRLVTMDAVIDALPDDGTLQQIRDAFAFVMESLKEDTAIVDGDVLDERAVELDALTLRFRAAMGKSDLKPLRQSAQDALHAQEDRLTALRNQAFSGRKRLFLKQFDRTSCVYGEVIDGLDDASYNKAKLMRRLRSIADLRPKLEAAINDAHRACQSTPLFKCSRGDVEDLTNLQRMVQESFTYLRDEIVNTGVTDRQRVALRALRADLENLAEDLEDIDGADELRERAAELLERFANAEGKFAAKEYDVVDDLITDIDADYRRLDEEFQRRRA